MRFTPILHAVSCGFCLFFCQLAAAESLNLSGWKRIDFDAGNNIEVENNIIHIISDHSASAYYYEFKKPISKPFKLSWQWKVNAIFAARPRFKEHDDYAARVYVVFRSNWKNRALNYVLTNDKVQPSHWQNPYSAFSMMLARPGASVGEWQSQFALPFDDYQRLFHRVPGKAVGIAVMSDTDDTGAYVEAWYKQITIDYLL